MHTKEYELNQAAYRDQKDFIRQSCSPGRFVAIAGGKIVADAATFREIDKMLDEMGFTSPDVVVVEAGVDYPEHAIIFTLDGSWTF